MRGITAPDTSGSGSGTPGTSLLGIPARLVRIAIWSTFAVALTTFLSVHSLLSDDLSSHVATESILSVVFVLACGALFAAWAHTRDMERRFWAFVLAGALFLTAARLYETSTLAGIWAESIPAGEVLSGLLEMAAVASIFGLVTTFTRFRHASRVAQVRAVVDVLSVSLISAGILEIWVIGPWYDGFGRVSGWARVVYSASPVLGALAFAGMLAAVLGTRADRWESWERLLVLAMSAMAVGLVLAPISYADVTWNAVGGWAEMLSELAWLSAGMLAIAGAVYRHLEEKRPWRLRPLAVLEPGYGLASSIVLPTVEIAALLAFGLAAAGATDVETRMVRLGIVGWLALTVAVRTLLTVADTHALASGIVTDPLTGLYNHRHMHRALGEEIASAVRYGEPVSVIALDLDDFGRTNAVAGHSAGDAVLASVAHALERAVRTRDIVCRAGGDDFVVIVPGADDVVAHAVAVRILAEVRTLSVPGVGNLSVSAGVAGLPADDGDDLLGRAEAALRIAQADGGDRAVVYDAALAGSADPEERIRGLRERADIATVRALAAAVDARDEATQDHSRNVARHAAMLAREIGLSEPEVLHLEYAGLLHDVGKIGLPDSLLRKTGIFTAADHEQMRTHVLLGEEILQSTTMRDILPWVRHHHERWDGTGYPDGLAGADIPLGARILALANAYDSMRSERPYRVGLSRSAALQEIDLALGTVFDPALGETFIDAIGRTFL